MATYDLTSSIPSSSSLAAGDILNCPYSGTYKSITLPNGTYKLECWGAQGGSYSATYAGGNGGYSYGTLTLTASTTVLYIYTGGQGESSSSAVDTGLQDGGYNGGGNGHSSTASYLCSAGGGASDIRIGQDSLYARVIVAGGGGGSGSYNGSNHYTGGAGGGTSGETGNQYTTSYPSGTGGSATAAGTSYYGSNYANSASYGTLAAFGTGGSAPSSSGVAGGGGGWYGGGYARRAGGGGGSGYVYTSSTASSYPSGCLLNSSYYLTNAQTIAGDTSFISPTGTSETGHSGNGYIRITVQSIVNWAYSTVFIAAPTYNKSNTSSWTLSPDNCRYFAFTPTISGDFIVYSNSSIDTYGYLTTSITALNSNGQPSSYIVSDDDGAKKYGGSGNNFGICYKVTAGTTYYIYVKPYSTSTSSSSVYLTYYMAHPDTRVFVKIDSSTWKQITN